MYFDDFHLPRTIVSRWNLRVRARSDREKRQVGSTNLTAVLALCTCSGSVFAVSQTSSFQFLQKPGPHPVGLKVVDQYDRSRTYSANAPSPTTAGDEARPLQTLICYPSL